MSNPLCSPWDLRPGLNNVYINRYLDEIKRPMDLRTLEENLTQGKYRTMREFEVDTRLIFNNCRQFNPPGTVVVQAADVLEHMFDKEWAKANEKKLSSADRSFALKTLTSMMADAM